ncbi:protein DBF4 homolog B-like [Xiphophorus maculatus]|uniref:Protein DBF4 homolog B-like n=1 Tax=Xiphophorus maculatus TaxID=8083 RepID=A0A3B5RDC8_XIPMA|nr:protein DBF4 homolog B-like [Xiphophorus maculatus]
MQPQQSAKERGLLGRLCAGDKKLEGKTFYLDNVKKRSTTLLLEAIPLLGGKVESFLHKDVTFVVTGNQESLKEDKKGEEKGTNEGSQHLMKKPDNCLSKDKQPPVNSRLGACGSRGKALLEKAMCNNERQQRSSVLSNARSWGVKILYVDDVLLYLKHLSRESFSAKPKRPEKTSTKQSVPTVKAAPLRTPYLKIEDSNRKYKPLHMQSVAFPSLYFLGRFSPFESPPPPLFGQGNDKKRENKVENNSKEKSPTQLSCNPPPWRPRRKDASYCECCHETFANLEEHLQSDAHRSFVLDPSNYKSVDQIVAEMLPGFDPNPPQQPEQSRALTPLPVDELELCTDAEVEDAVQDLKRDDSNQADLKFTSRNVSSDPTDNHSAHVQPEASSPTMPVLTIEPLDQQLDTSCPDAPCLLPDPYSLPPVLSPQVPHSHSIMDPPSPYPEPPVLSPQQFNSEETHGLQTYGSALPLPSLLPVFSDGLEEEKGLKIPTQPLSRQSSFPRLSAAVPNPRKRCRSASPEHRSSKRRKNGRFLLKPQTDNMANAVDRLSFDPVRRCFPETLGSFSVSAAQNFTPTLFQMDSATPVVISNRDSECSHPHSTSECIEPALIPDLATCAVESSDSDWDRGLLSAPAPPASGKLDKELLHRPCPWMHDSSYESHLHTVLQPPAPLCGEDVDPATFSRTVVQIVEVQH